MSEGVAVSVPDKLSVGGLDQDLLREMQESGFLNEEDLASLSVPQALPMPPVNVTAEEVEEVAKELATHEARQELYAEQESHADLVEPENEVLEASEAGKSRARKARAASTAPKAPRVARTGTFASPGAYVASFVGPTVELIEGQPAFNTAELVDGINAKKITEKAVNFFDHFHKGRTLSVFTQIALDTLKREGQISAKRLVEVYQSTAKRSGSSYNDGTARSQAQQEITLLKRLGIVTGSGIADTASTYWQKISG